MQAVRVTITRYVDDDQPGWVEAHLTDARGKEWVFIEKVPILTSTDLHAGSCYPQPGVIACQTIERSPDTAESGVVTVDTKLPWGVESTTGATRFEVFRDQLVTLD
jgi:hypothetical protein